MSLVVSAVRRVTSGRIFTTQGMVFSMLPGVGRKIRRCVGSCLALIAVVACDPAMPPSLELTGATMGTTYSVVVADPGEVSQQDIEAVLVKTLATVNAQMSNWDSESEVSQFNNNETTAPIAVSAELAEVITAARLVHLKSDRLFDITLSPLIELWGFGSDGNDNLVPTDELINDALQQVGHERLLQASPLQSTITKRHPKVSVNLAAIAKGYGIDQLASALDALKLENYMIEIGGDLYTRGRNANGTEWMIGIEKPESGSPDAVGGLAVTDKGVATSGDYRNAFQENGKRYSHIIDPRNGKPIEHHTASATVIGESAMMADAWATAMLVLGSARGLEIADEERIAVQFIDRKAGKFVVLDSAALKIYARGGG